MFSVACYVGFASCKTFGKQPKRPCFGRSPKAGRRDASPRIHPLSGGKGGRGIGIINQKFISKTDFFYNLKRASAFTDVRFSVYCLSILTSYRFSQYSICKRYAKICGDAFGRKTAQLPKMSFTITKKAMRVQDELHNLPIWVMSFC